MTEVLGAIFIGLVVLTLAAAAIYLLSFLVSMAGAIYGTITDVATHHHHGLTV